MKVFCSWHPGGRKFLHEKPPFDNPKESDTLCGDCEKKETAKLDAVEVTRLYFRGFPFWEAVAMVRESQ